MMDGSLRYIWVLNPQLGLTEEQMIGKTDYEILSREEADELTLAKSKVLSSGESTRFSTSLIAKNGGREYFDGAFIPQKDEQGRTIGLMGYFRNVTETVRANDALRLANRKLNLLSSITRHDIINQILVLEGNLAVVEEGLTDAALRERMAKANKAADRIADMIKFTKEYENIGVTSPVWQDARSLVEASAEEMHPGVEFINGIQRDMDIFADPLITKVFRNLIDNSIKHGGEVKKISFSQRKSKNAMVLVYQDDGVGISEETRKNLFTRGYGKDHGLGLFLSRDILAITGISIEEDGNGGPGARFVLTFPAGTWRVRT
jgi:signal transduction histidine kinase